MTGTDDPCARWLAQARIAADRLTADLVIPSVGGLDVAALRRLWPS